MVYLKTSKSFNRFKIGQSMVYDKESEILFNCLNCKERISIPLFTVKNNQDKITIIDLEFPNKSGYTLEFIRSISDLFNLKEKIYAKTNIHTYKTKTPHGEYDCFAMIVNCNSCDTRNIICLSLYGDYSRYPGTNVNMVGIEEFNDYKI